MKPQAQAVYRQGDVLLQRVAQMPENAVPVNSDGRIVLAYGEVTGHAHALSNTVAKLFMWEGERYLQVQEGAQLVHEEHATIVLPAGLYKVVQQREYVPQSAPRDVVD